MLVWASLRNWGYHLLFGDYKEVITGTLVAGLHYLVDLARFYIRP
jgi:hypothetical protein